MAYCCMTEVLARYRAVNTEVSVSLHEMPLHQQVSWIRDDLLDASVSVDGGIRDGIQAQPVARDTLCAVVPISHPLAPVEVVTPADLLRYPVLVFSAETDLGAGSKIENFVDAIGHARVAFRANSLGTMLTLVALGHGIGLVGSAQVTGVRRSDVVLRPIGGVAPLLTTYVLHSNCGVSGPLEAFIELARELCASAESTTAPFESRDLSR